MATVLMDLMATGRARRVALNTGAGTATASVYAISIMVFATMGSTVTGFAVFVIVATMVLYAIERVSVKTEIALME